MNKIVKHWSLIRGRVMDAIDLDLGHGSRGVSAFFRSPFAAPAPAMPALRLYSLPRGIRLR